MESSSRRSDKLHEHRALDSPVTPIVWGLSPLWPGSIQYGEDVRARAWTILIVVSAAITVAAGIVTGIYFLQPWRSCPYEDTSAGCAMLPGDAAVMAVAMWSGLVGVVMLGVALALRRRASAH
jgi:hypothetical protein